MRALAGRRVGLAKQGRVVPEPHPLARRRVALPMKGKGGFASRPYSAACLGLITALTSRYSAKPKSPHSRPLPLIL